jgi:histone-lysine N-methyltransferase SETMAR
MVRMRAEFVDSVARHGHSNSVYASRSVFIMFKIIENPATYEMRPVIHSLNAKNMKPGEIHPPYTPDLAPSDFHLYLHLKSFLAGRRFHDDNEVKEAVTTCFASQAASFYHEGIQKLVQRYDKCLNNIHGL